MMAEGFADKRTCPRKPEAKALISASTRRCEINQRAGVMGQSLTRRRQRHALALADEQGRGEGEFQLKHALGYRRGRNVPPGAAARAMLRSSATVTNRLRLVRSSFTGGPGAHARAVCPAPGDYSILILADEITFPQNSSSVLVKAASPSGP